MKTLIILLALFNLNLFALGPESDEYYVYGVHPESAEDKLVVKLSVNQYLGLEKSHQKLEDCQLKLDVYQSNSIRFNQFTIKKNMTKEVERLLFKKQNIPEQAKSNSIKDGTGVEDLTLQTGMSSKTDMIYIKILNGVAKIYNEYKPDAWSVMRETFTYIDYPSHEKICRIILDMENE